MMIPWWGKIIFISPLFATSQGVVHLHRYLRTQNKNELSPIYAGLHNLYSMFHRLDDFFIIFLFISI